jgi:hypothetical protein
MKRQNMLLIVRRSGVSVFAWLLSAVVVLSILALHTSTVVAAPAATTLTTSPVSVTLEGDPGATVSTDLQLQNNSTARQLITIKLEKFKASGTDGQAQIMPPESNDQTLSWVHFSTPTFVAEPGVWKSVKMTIDIPKTAAFGYYYAVVFSPAHQEAVSGMNVFRGANAILVLLHVRTPGEKDELRVADFSATQGIYQYLPATFHVNVRNTGDIFTQPRGTIYISRRAGGKVIDTIDVNKGQGSILPATNRIFESTWDDGFPVYVAKRVNGQIVSDKSGKPVTELSWDTSKLSKLRFGSYNAHLVLAYNNGLMDIPLQADVTFWVIPWTLLGIAILILLILLVGVGTILRVVIMRHPHYIRLR